MHGVGFEVAETNTYRDQDRDITVTVLGRTGIRYSAGGKACRVSSEVLVKGIAIYPGTLHQWEDGQPIDDRGRSRIIEDIVEAIESCVPNEAVSIIQSGVFPIGTHRGVSRQRIPPP